MAEILLEGRDMAKDKPKTEEEDTDDPAGVTSAILSMLASAGGAIPSLLRQPEEDYLRQAQRGQGTGASLARQTASEAGRRVAGNVQGADLREGLRAADQIASEGAARAGTIGAQESLAATGSLRAGTFNRRRAGQRFGAGLGMGLAGIGATLAAAKDQGPAATAPTGGVSPELAAAEAGAPPWFSNAPVPGAPAAPQTQLQPPGDLQAAPQAPSGPYQLQQPFPAQPKPQVPYGAAQNMARPSQGAPGGAQTPQTPPDSAKAPGAITEAVKQATDPGVQIMDHMSQAADAGMKLQEAKQGYLATASTPEAEANSALLQSVQFNPYWETLAIQLADKEIQEDQARDMLRISGAPPEIAEMLIQGAIAGQRAYSIDLAKVSHRAKINKAAEAAGAFAGKGPNRPKEKVPEEPYRSPAGINWGGAMWK